jgi:distribution and morphology protein 31
VISAALLAWNRHAHRSAPKGLKNKVERNRRNKSSTTNGAPPKNNPTGKGSSAPQAELSPQPNTPPKPNNPDAKLAPESSGSTKHLLDRLPHMPHLYRPSKAELLEAASGFWSRMKVHFKWFTIRSNRKFNADEIYALISWILAAHILWIVVGTTTFFSLTIFMINTVFAQETLAQWIGNYLTQSSGIKVIFESAVVPKWKDGVISFRKVFVSRRPGQGRAKVSKGSQTSAAAAAAAIAQKERDIAEGVEEEEEDTNYTQFDISIDTVNVTLSFSNWMNGNGLLKDVEIKGIRGVVDRTSVFTPDDYGDPRSYKHEHQPGDFELDSFKMEDLLVTVYQPGNFRPFPVSIYSCDLPQLRKQWLFYDFLSANMMSGSYDNSMFAIHPRQTHNYAGSQLNGGLETEDGHSWKKQSRIRIDGLNIDHLNRGYEGPFSWIHEGNVDIVADLMIPDENDDSIAKVMSDMYDRMEATVSKTHKHFSDHAHGFEDSHSGDIVEDTAEDKRFLIMDIRVHLNDVRAAVPIFTRDLSYVNNALVRPIVAYINSKRTFIPVNCRVVKRVDEFDGSWTIYDSGLMDDMSREVNSNILTLFLENAR